MIHVPTMTGRIDRRILVNFRVDPDVARAVIPRPFRPNLSLGVAVGGICLIRLADLRPKGLPARIGVTTENAAHRFAVEFDGPEGVSHGVYIPRRDTASLLTLLGGGRAFPGEHHRAHFDVHEAPGSYDVALRSRDSKTRVAVHAREANELPASSVFPSLSAASEFFRRDPVGYSATRTPGRYEAMELDVEQWAIDPLAVAHVASSYFHDPHLFPPGSVEFDCALSMRPTPAQWISHPQLDQALGVSVSA
jgi:hypothetical protein